MKNKKSNLILDPSNKLMAGLKNMKDKLTVEQEAQILLNNEVRVTFAKSQMFGQTGIVEGIMADGRTLDVKLSNGKNAILDVTFVSEIQERTQFAKTPQSLGPIANSVIQDTL